MRTGGSSPLPNDRSNTLRVRKLFAFEKRGRIARIRIFNFIKMERVLSVVS
jgi:hypothetical protein